jgi:hypothetical protein
MAFNLEITITGLCMFVPRSESRMDVLMVAAGGGMGGCRCGCMQRHYARVFYDAAYNSDDPNALPGECVGIALEDRLLDLTQLGGNGETVKPLRNLVDVGAIVGKSVSSDLNAIPSLAACVALPPGFVAYSLPYGPWELYAPGAGVNTLLLPYYVVWTIEGIDDTELRWELRGLGGLPDQPLAPLYPKRGQAGNAIKLTACNVTKSHANCNVVGDPGSPPPPNYPMDHFEAFYDLYDWDGFRPVPIYAPKQSGASKSTAYTCVPSGGH